jgi:hypothetical protein
MNDLKKFDLKMSSLNVRITLFHVQIACFRNSFFRHNNKALII